MFGGLVALALLGWLLYVFKVFIFGYSMPKLEVSPQVSQLVTFSDCDASLLEVTCKITSRARFPIDPDFFASVQYDKKGARLGVWSFPNQNINPGETIKASITLSSELDEVRRLVITFAN